MDNDHKDKTQSLREAIERQYSEEINQLRLRREAWERAQAKKEKKP